MTTQWKEITNFQWLQQNSLNTLPWGMTFYLFTWSCGSCIFCALCTKEKLEWADARRKTTIFSNMPALSSELSLPICSWGNFLVVGIDLHIELMAMSGQGHNCCSSHCRGCTGLKRLKINPYIFYQYSNLKCKCLERFLALSKIWNVFKE